MDHKVNERDHKGIAMGAEENTKGAEGLQKEVKE